MSLKGETSKLCKILTDLTYELDVFTKYKHSSNICKIVNSLYDVNIKILVKVMLTLRKINNDDLLEKNNKHAHVYMKEIYKLLSTRNCLDDADTHPIGQDLSIFSCAAKSQDVLNVKRLKQKTTMLESNTMTPLLNHVINILKLKNESIQPTVKDSSLHTNDIIWFRIILNGDVLQSFIRLYEDNEIFKEHLHDVFVLAEEFNIIEVYYKKKVKISQILILLNESVYVKEIIFCSELENMKKLKIRPCDVFSNMLKFYYCYKTNSFTFDITTQKNMKIFHYVYLMCSIFIHSSKFTAYNSIIAPSPLSSLSYYKPMINIQPKAKMVEPISEYEKVYVKEHGTNMLCNTAVSEESYKLNKRHVLYTVCQDRDKRILHNYSNIGGVNQSELVINQIEKCKLDQIEILRKLSTHKEHN